MSSHAVRCGLGVGCGRVGSIRIDGAGQPGLYSARCLHKPQGEQLRDGPCAVLSAEPSSALNSRRSRLHWRILGESLGLPAAASLESITGRDRRCENSCEVAHAYPLPGRTGQRCVGGPPRRRSRNQSNDAYRTRGLFSINRDRIAQGSSPCSKRRRNP